MLFFTLLVAVVVALTVATKIHEIDYQTPAITQQMVERSTT